MRGARPAAQQRPMQLASGQTAGFLPPLITPPASVMGQQLQGMARGVPYDRGQVMQDAGNPFQNQGPLQGPRALPGGVAGIAGLPQGPQPFGSPGSIWNTPAGPLGALQDSLPGMNQGQTGFSVRGTPPAGMQMQQQMNPFASPGSPRVAPVGPRGPILGALQQAPSAYPQRRRRLPRY